MTIDSRLEKRREIREEALNYFWSKLPVLKDDRSGLSIYYYMKYISMNLMQSKSMEEFILRAIMHGMNAEKTLGILEEYDWVYHCVISAQKHAGKGNNVLPQYRFIFGNDTLIRYYERKVLQKILDHYDGINTDLVELLAECDGEDKKEYIRKYATKK